MALLVGKTHQSLAIRSGDRLQVSPSCKTVCRQIFETAVSAFKKVHQITCINLTSHFGRNNRFSQNAQFVTFVPKAGNRGILMRRRSGFLTRSKSDQSCEYQSERAGQTHNVSFSRYTAFGNPMESMNVLVCL